MGLRNRVPTKLYSRPQPDFQGASRGNRQQLLQTLFFLQNQVNDLKNTTASGTVNSQTPAVISTVPPQAKFSTTLNGTTATVEITNPEFDTQKPGNPNRRPIYHLIELSPYQTFARQVTKLPWTTQTYIPVAPFNPGTYMRLRSSYDGVNSNQAQIANPVTA
jgi:hypothetical protein